MMGATFVLEHPHLAAASFVVQVKVSPTGYSHRVLMADRDYQHSRPLDAHYWSEHKEANEFVDYIFDTANADVKACPFLSIWDDLYAFPRYTSASGTNANSASAAINKWLKPRVPEGCVIHSFRHLFRDRLRAVFC